MLMARNPPIEWSGTIEPSQIECCDGSIVMKSRPIRAVLMRGGTSKGVFFHSRDLPADAATRDRVLLRVLGSPDPYGKQMDGLGGGYSSTSKAVLISPSTRPDSDIDYLFGQVSVDRALVDWSGSCGNLIGGVGPFAITEGLVTAPADGIATVRVWQVNLGQRILVKVPMRHGEVEEDGVFEVAGVAFPGAEIRIDFLESSDPQAAGIFPTSHVVEPLVVHGRPIEATMIDAGMPTIIVDAMALGLSGTELSGDMADKADLFAYLEEVRAAGAVAMGLAPSARVATEKHPHSPKLAFVTVPRDYKASDGSLIEGKSIELIARIISMGTLHHALTGTGAVAIAAAATVQGTIVQRIVGDVYGHPVTLGHTSGRLAMEVVTTFEDGTWRLRKITMSRTARRLMEGYVRIPADIWPDA